MNEKYFIDSYRRISADERAQLSHIVLYVNLLAYWQEQNYQNPLAITREKLMSTARIKSKVTYHKCIRELSVFGYIDYNPSYDPYRSSSVTILNPFEQTFPKEVQVQKEIIIRIPFNAENLQIPNAGKAVFVSLRKAKGPAKPK
jgi:hypothetical protein